MKKSTLLGAVCASLMTVSFSVQATIVTQLLEDVTILETLYDVTFLQDDGGAEDNSFDDILPEITFTTEADATAAVVAILNAVGPDYDFEPGDTFGPSNGFRVPYAAAALTYSYMVGREDSEGDQVVNGPFTKLRGDSNVYSFATFEETAVIPVPAAVWLFGSGLIGLVGIARKRAA